MVLADLGRRINAAVSDLTRSNLVDEKARDFIKLPNLIVDLPLETILANIETTGFRFHDQGDM